MKLSQKISEALNTYLEEWDLLPTLFFPFSDDMVVFIQGLWYQGLISFSCDYIMCPEGRHWLQIIIPILHSTEGTPFITFSEGTPEDDELFFKADSSCNLVQTLLGFEKKARELIAQLPTEIVGRPS